MVYLLGRRSSLPDLQIDLCSEQTTALTYGEELYNTSVRKKITWRGQRSMYTSVTIHVTLHRLAEHL
jgi:hypothetical protein